MVSLEGVELGEDSSVLCCDVCHSLCWGGGLVSLALYEPVEAGEVDAHSDLVRSFLRCHHNRCAPLCRLSDWCDDPLLLQQFQLRLEFVAIGEGDGPGCLDAKRLGIVGEGDVEFLS